VQIKKSNKQLSTSEKKHKALSLFIRRVRREEKGSGVAPHPGNSFAVPLAMQTIFIFYFFSNPTYHYQLPKYIY
jgi:hypothetical protein